MGHRGIEVIGFNSWDEAAEFWKINNWIPKGTLMVWDVEEWD